MSTRAIQAAPRARSIERLSAARRDRVAAHLLPAWRAWCGSWELGQADVRVEPLVQGGAIASAEAWQVAGARARR